MPSVYRKKKSEIDGAAVAVGPASAGQALPAAGCGSSKVRHGSQREAELAARVGMLAGAPDLTVYWCIHCDLWHLTSAVARKSPRKRRAR